MSFVPLSKPSHRGGGSPMITIGHAQQNRQTYLSLNSAPSASRRHSPSPGMPRTFSSS